APLASPGLDTQRMKAKLPPVGELGDVLHTGDRQIARVAWANRAKVQREPGFFTSRELSGRQLLANDRNEIGRGVGRKLRISRRGTRLAHCLMNDVRTSPTPRGARPGRTAWDTRPCRRRRRRRGGSKG